MLEAIGLLFTQAIVDFLIDALTGKEMLIIEDHHVD